jgi:hypothetical protein
MARQERSRIVTEVEARLERALKTDGVPPRDPMFRIEVLARRERAAFRRRLLLVSAKALGAVILAGLGLSLINEPGDESSTALATLAAAGALLMAFLAATSADLWGEVGQAWGGRASHAIWRLVAWFGL